MLLEAKGIYKRFRQEGRKDPPLQVLSGVEVSLGEGETLGIVGATGSGKTTLAQILAGLIPPDEGEVLYKGEALWPRPGTWRRADHRRIQIVWQHPDTAFDPSWRLRQSLLEPYRLHHVPVTETTLIRMLHQVGLGPQILERRPRQLSGGELQRLAIARALSLEPGVLILDEPTSMLDALTQASLIRLLQEIQRQRKLAYMFISHDHDLVRVFCHRMFALDAGTLTPIYTPQPSPQ